VTQKPHAFVAARLTVAVLPRQLGRFALHVQAFPDLGKHGPVVGHNGDQRTKRNDSDPGSQMAVCQNLVPLVNIKIAGKWMFIPLKMVLIGIDP